MQPSPWAETSRPSLPSVRIAACGQSLAGRDAAGKPVTAQRRGGVSVGWPCGCAASLSCSRRPAGRCRGRRRSQRHRRARGCTPSASCTNLLGYAQRNGVPRGAPDDRAAPRRGRCRCRRAVGGGRRGGAATAGGRRPAPSPRPSGRRGRGHLADQRAGGGRRRAGLGQGRRARRCSSPRDGTLHALDASGDRAARARHARRPGLSARAAGARRPRARDLQLGFGGPAGTGRRSPRGVAVRRAVARPHPAARGRHLRPRARCGSLRDARRRGLLPQRAAHRRDGPRHRARPSRAGSSMPDVEAAQRARQRPARLAARRAPHAHARRGCRRPCCATAAPGTERRRALVRCRAGAPHAGVLRPRHADRADDRHGGAACPAVDADAMMIDGDTVYASQDRLYVASQRWLGAGPVARRDRSTSRPPGCTRSRPRRPARRATSAAARSRATCSTSGRCPSTRASLRAATTSMPPWRQRRAQRERRAHAGGARRAARRRSAPSAGSARASGSTPCASSGDTGFVVTFRQVDPLYTLDLSDPRAPRVVGELKVPGYSAYLHPVGDGLLLGVGPGRDGRGPHARACSCRCSTSRTSRSPPGWTRAPRRRAPTRRSRATTTRSSGGRRRTSRSSRSSGYDDEHASAARWRSASTAAGSRRLARIAHPTLEAIGGPVHDRSVVRRRPAAARRRAHGRALDALSRAGPGRRSRPSRADRKFRPGAALQPP